MTKAAKRKHAERTNGNSRYHSMPYDYDYGGVYYINPPQLPPPYYSQMPPPYFYAMQNGRHPALQNGGPRALPSSAGMLIQNESSLNPKRTKFREENEEVKQIEKEKKDQKTGSGRPSLLKKISNGIVFGLEKFFYRVGMFVGSNPKKVIAVTILIPCLLGIGLVRIRRDRDFAGLLIPADSRIHTDAEWVQNNIPYELRLIQFILVNENVLTKKSLLHMYDVYNASLNIRVNGLGLTDFCNKILDDCYVTSILDLWNYDLEVIETLTEEQIQETINTTVLNPMFYTEFFTKRYLGERTLDSDGKILAAKAATMTWNLYANSTNKDTILEFEKKMIDLGKKEAVGFEDVDVLTIESFSEEFFDSVYTDLTLIVYSAPAVFLYTVLAMGKPNMVEHGFFLVFAGVFGVLLAALTCFGLCLLTGLIFGVLHTGLIFLLLGIGVDDTFVVVETWKRVAREHPEKSLEEKMALTMKHAGVSVTVTSVSDFAAFAAGITTVMPILSSFCVYSAVGMLSLFVIQSTFFPACLILDQKRIQAKRNGFVPCYTHKNYKPNKFSNTEILEPFFKKVWGRLLLSIPGKIFILLASAGLIGAMSWSATKLQKGFDIQAVLNPASYARQFLDANERYFPGEGFPFAVYCDTTDLYAYHKELHRMEERYRNNSAILNGQVTSWIKPFLIYIQYVKQYFGDPVVLDDDGFPEGREKFNEYLFYFIYDSGFGDAYKNVLDVKRTNDSEFGLEARWTIHRMSMIIEKDPSINDQSLREIRRIADTTNTDGTCFAYSELFVLTEAIEYVDRELIRNFLLAGVSVFVVVLLLVVDLRSSFFVCLCVAFTTICLGGTLQFGGFIIDGNIVIMTTFCIGLSVDFSAHIAYMFMTVKGTRNERVQKSLEKIGPAIFHGAASTMIVVVFLSMARSYTIYLFFVTFISIMIYGLFAGLCLLPVLLSLIGPDPYPDAENVDSPPRRRFWYNSELMLKNQTLKIPRPQLKNSDDLRKAEKRYPDSDSDSSKFNSSTEYLTYKK